MLRTTLTSRISRLRHRKHITSGRMLCAHALRVWEDGVVAAGERKTLECELRLQATITALRMQIKDTRYALELDADVLEARKDDKVMSGVGLQESDSEGVDQVLKKREHSNALETAWC